VRLARHDLLPWTRDIKLTLFVRSEFMMGAGLLLLTKTKEYSSRGSASLGDTWSLFFLHQKSLINGWKSVHLATDADDLAAAKLAMVLFVLYDLSFFFCTSVDVFTSTLLGIAVGFLLANF